jgi:SMC interacting uncharacterized protein involved in chromosome segregation
VVALRDRNVKDQQGQVLDRDGTAVIEKLKKELLILTKKYKKLKISVGSRKLTLQAKITSIETLKNNYGQDLRQEFKTRV